MRRMKKKTPIRKLQRSDTADHKFAIATLILLAFLFVGGMASWLSGENPSAAAQSSTPPSPKR